MGGGGGGEIMSGRGYWRQNYGSSSNGRGWRG